MNTYDHIYKILIVDDHQLTHAGIKSILSTHSKYQISGILSEGAQVIPYVKSEAIDIVLLDMNLPDVSGTSLLPELVGILDMTTIIITGESSASEMNFALIMGARAIVSKGDPAHFVIDALNKVILGETYLSPQIQKWLSVPEISEISVSPRQMAILHYLAQGETNKEIGFRLKIAAPTVSFHLKQIRTKIGVKGNKKILFRAKQLGLI